MMITDAAINIAPDVDTQIGIVENALPVANALGVELPKVAVLSAVENVTEKMPSTVSAAEIAKRGIPGCVVSGPWRWTAPSPWSPSSTRAFTTPWRPGGHSAGALYRDRQRAVQVHHLYRRKDHGQHHLRCLLPGDHHQPGRHAGQQVLLHPAGDPALPEGISTITI